MCLRRGELYLRRRPIAPRLPARDRGGVQLQKLIYITAFICVWEVKRADSHTYFKALYSFPYFKAITEWDQAQAVRGGAPGGGAKSEERGEETKKRSRECRDTRV